ncbi:hypothetical protein [Pseudoalteromonas sp. MSK9-3]|nr:hypothetical protein [Pseudoalteromonas sp. MSK9-3]
MNQIAEKMQKSKLFQRILKVGLVYVVLEVIVAFSAVFFVAHKIIT